MNMSDLVLPFASIRLADGAFELKVATNAVSAAGVDRMPGEDKIIRERSGRRREVDDRYC